MTYNSIRPFFPPSLPLFLRLFLPGRRLQVGREEIPHTHGVQVRVVGAAVAAATVRSLLECPIEFAKVARQTGQDWKLNQVYR